MIYELKPSGLSLPYIINTALIAYIVEQPSTQKNSVVIDIYFSGLAKSLAVTMTENTWNTFRTKLLEEGKTPEIKSPPASPPS